MSASSEFSTKIGLAAKAGAVTLNIGIFLNALISFLIVAFVLFLIVRAVNKLFVKQQADAAPAAPPEEVTNARPAHSALVRK